MNIWHTTGGSCYAKAGHYRTQLTLIIARARLPFLNQPFSTFEPLSILPDAGALYGCPACYMEQPAHLFHIKWQ